MFRVLVLDMLSNIVKTQREILHSVSNSAFCVEYNDGNRVYNGMIPTHHKNHLYILDIAPATMHTAQAKPGSNSPQHPTFNQLLWINHRFSAAASNLLHLFSWLQTPTSFNHLCHFFQKAQIFLSLLVNNQTLMQAADNKCFMEDEIFLTS